MTPRITIMLLLAVLALVAGAIITAIGVRPMFGEVFIGIGVGLVIAEAVVRAIERYDD